MGSLDCAGALVLTWMILTGMAATLTFCVMVAVERIEHGVVGSVEGRAEDIAGLAHPHSRDNGYLAIIEPLPTMLIARRWQASHGCLAGPCGWH